MTEMAVGLNVIRGNFHCHVDAFTTATPLMFCFQTLNNLISPSIIIFIILRIRSLYNTLLHFKYYHTLNVLHSL